MEIYLTTEGELQLSIFYMKLGEEEKANEHMKNAFQRGYIKP